MNRQKLSILIGIMLCVLLSACGDVKEIINLLVRQGKHNTEYTKARRQKRKTNAEKFLSML